MSDRPAVPNPGAASPMQVAIDVGSSDVLATSFDHEER
jgi:hypothetical protein